MHPNVPGGRIHRADKGDHRNEDEMLQAWDCDPGHHHQGRAGEKQRAQAVARSQEPDGQGGGGRAEERSGGHQADLKRIKPNLEQIGRQDDGGEPVAKAARGACRVETGDVRASG